MMPSTRAFAEADLQGKTPLELLLKVYDGALGAFESARVHARQGNQDLAIGQLGRAEKFVVHLYTTLDMERGGEVAEHLANLYAHVVKELRDMTATGDLARLDSCVKVLGNLREAWSQLAAQHQLPVKTNQPKHETISGDAMVQYGAREFSA